jgi:hypothetical protein
VHVAMAGQVGFFNHSFNGDLETILFQMFPFCEVAQGLTKFTWLYGRVLGEVK